MILKEQIRVFENNGISLSRIAKEAGIPCSTLSHYMRNNVVIKEETEAKIISALQDMADTLYAVVHSENASGYDDDGLEAFLGGE